MEFNFQKKIHIYSIIIVALTVTVILFNINGLVYNFFEYEFQVRQARPFSTLEQMRLIDYYEREIISMMIFHSMMVVISVVNLILLLNIYILRRKIV